jgi:dephospho-CoA kinase
MKINRKKTEVMVCSKDYENINIKMDDDIVKQVTKFKYLGSIFTEDGKNEEDIIKRFKEAKVMFNNKKQLLCSNNLSLEMKKKLIKSYKSYVDDVGPGINMLAEFLLCYM